MLIPLLMNLNMFQAGVTPPEPEPAPPPATGGGGGKGRGKSRGGKRPPYWWEASYQELREIRLPEEPQSHEAAFDTLVRLQALWRDLDQRDVKFKRMMGEVDRLIERCALLIESHRIAQLLEETKQRIWAAEEARKARMEADEMEELLRVL